MAVLTELKKQISSSTQLSVGLIAGDGKLPALLAKSAKEKGYRVVVAALSEDARTRIMAHSDKVSLILPGQIGRHLKYFKDEGIKEMVFIGKVPKLNLLRNITKLDWTAIVELSKLTDFNDDSIQRAVGNLVESHGVKVLTQREFLKHLFPNIGVLTQRQPTAEEYADIEFGFRAAKELARLNIGQTVVVKDQMILAVEAIEGTDQAIARAIELARRPVVVVKVSKQDQDQRFDMPTVGMSTLNSMIAPQPGGVLAVEAGQTLMVERPDMVQFAGTQGMSIVAI